MHLPKSSWARRNKAEASPAAPAPLTFIFQGSRPPWLHAIARLRRQPKAPQVVWPQGLQDSKVGGRAVDLVPCHRSIWRKHLFFLFCFCY